MQTDPIALASRPADNAGDRHGRRAADKTAGGQDAFADMLAVDAAGATPRDASVADHERNRRSGQAEADPERLAAAPQASDPTNAAETAPPVEMNGGLPTRPLPATPSAGLPPASSRDAVGVRPLPTPPPVPPASDGAANAGIGTPPSAQAADLARVVAAGTRVQVTRTDAGTGGLVPPLGGDSIVVLAAGEDGRHVERRGRTTHGPGSSPPAQMTLKGNNEASFLPVADPKALSERTVPMPLAGSTGADRDDAGGGAAFPAQTPPGNGAGRPAAANTIVPQGVVASPSVSGGSIDNDTAAPAMKSDGFGPQHGNVHAPDTQLASASPAPTPATAAPAAMAGSHRAPDGDAAQPPSAAGQISIHIAKAVQTGVDRIEIQLSPASLGRVEIRLDIADHHQVKIAISADTPETLDALRSDARLLERALHDAGLKADAGSLSFHLRDHGARTGTGGHHGRGNAHAHRLQAAAAIADVDPVPSPPAPALMRQAGRIDIRA